MVGVPGRRRASAACSGSRSGAKGQGKRLERGELSHSAVATSSPASLRRPDVATCDVCGLCQCRLPGMVPHQRYAFRVFYTCFSLWA